MRIKIGKFLSLTQQGHVHARSCCKHVENALTLCYYSKKTLSTPHRATGATRQFNGSLVESFMTGSGANCVFWNRNSVLYRIFQIEKLEQKAAIGSQ
jgi:hypothetical protein